MSEEKEYSELEKYISELKTLRSDIYKILDAGDAKEISRAAKHFPVVLNHLLTQRNIKSASGFPPFFVLAFMNLRKPDIELIDLNLQKDDKDLLRDTIQLIDRELEVQ